MLLYPQTRLQLPTNITIPATSPKAPYVGPLDLVAGAAFGFSQRALSSAGRGSALVTIRRSSDNTTQSFNSDARTGGMPLNAISGFIKSGSGFVTKWNDQSGNGNDVVQATAANQPGFVSSLGNGRSAFSFDASIPQGLVSAGNASCSGGSCTIFYVSQCTGLPGGQDTYRSGFAIARQLIGGSQNGDPNGGAIFGYLGGAGPSSGNSAFANSNSFTIQLQNLNVIDQTITFAALTTKFNGVSQTMQPPFNTGVTPCDNASGRIVVGGYAVDFTDPDFFSSNWLGWFSEIIVYPGVMSDANRTLVRNNMGSYYGIPTS